MALNLWEKIDPFGRIIQKTYHAVAAKTKITHHLFAMIASLNCPNQTGSPQYDRIAFIANQSIATENKSVQRLLVLGLSCKFQATVVSVFAAIFLVKAEESNLHIIVLF